MNRRGIKGELVTDGDNWRQQAAAAVAEVATVEAEPDDAVAKRDAALAELAELKQEQAETRDRLRRAVGVAQAEFDAWEAPRKRLEAAQSAYSAGAHLLSSEIATLRNEIEQSLPAYVTRLLAEWDRSLGHLRGAALERRRRGMDELKALAFTPGDLRERVRQIHDAVTTGDFSE